MKKQYKDDFVPHVGEYNNPRIFGHYVEITGYVPIHRQVDSFFRAGQRIVDQYSDNDYDTSDDDPIDDTSLDCRNWELEDVGHAMARLGSVTDSARQAAAVKSAVESGKNVTEGSPEEGAAEN